MEMVSKKKRQSRRFSCVFILLFTIAKVLPGGFRVFLDQERQTRKLTSCRPTMGPVNRFDYRRWDVAVVQGFSGSNCSVRFYFRPFQIRI